MSFKKYLQPPEIDPVIDPGQGEDLTNQIPNAPTDIKKQQNIAPTSISSLVNDIANSIKTINSKIDDAISQIVSANENNPAFTSLYQMLQANYFDPTVLLTDSSALPSNQYSQDQITQAGRQVYRTSIDPRSMFLEDLFSLKQQLGVQNYINQIAWSKIVETFKPDQPDNRLTRFSAYKDQEAVMKIGDEVDRISSLQPISLSSSFIQGFATQTLNNIQGDSVSEVCTSIQNVINTLQLIRGILETELLFTNKDWEMIKNNLKKANGEVLEDIALRVLGTLPYALLNGRENQIFNFINQIECILPQKYDSIPELKDFRLLTENGLLRQAKKIEDDLLMKERKAIEQENQRNLQYGNANKADQIKKYSDIITTAINYLQIIQSTIQLTKDLNIDVNNFIDTLSTSSINYNSQPVRIIYT